MNDIKTSRSKSGITKKTTQFQPNSTELARAIQTVGTNLQGLGTYTQGIARVVSNHAEALAQLNNQAQLQQGRLNQVWHEQKRLETIQEQFFVSQQAQTIETSRIQSGQRIQESQIELLETRCQQLQRIAAEQAKRLEALEDRRFNLTHSIAIALAIMAVSFTAWILTISSRQQKGAQQNVSIAPVTLKGDFILCRTTENPNYPASPMETTIQRG